MTLECAKSWNWRGTEHPGALGALPAYKVRRKPGRVNSQRGVTTAQKLIITSLPHLLLATYAPRSSCQSPNPPIAHIRTSSPTTITAASEHRTKNVFLTPHPTRNGLATDECPTKPPKPTIIPASSFLPYRKRKPTGIQLANSFPPVISVPARHRHGQKFC